MEQKHQDTWEATWHCSNWLLFNTQRGRKLKVLYWLWASQQTSEVSCIVGWSKSVNRGLNGGKRREFLCICVEKKTGISLPLLQYNHCLSLICKALQKGILRRRSREGWWLRPQALDSDLLGLSPLPVGCGTWRTFSVSSRPTPRPGSLHCSRTGPLAHPCSCKACSFALAVPSIGNALPQTAAALSPSPPSGLFLKGLIFTEAICDLPPASQLSLSTILGFIFPHSNLPYDSFTYLSLSTVFL